MAANFSFWVRGLLPLLVVLSAVWGNENDTAEADDPFENDVNTGHAKHSEMLFRLSINKTEEGLSKLLLKIDVNSDQIITKDELTEWILKSNEALEEKEAFEFIGQLDHDNDTGISWDEYFQHYYGSPTIEFARSNSDHQDILDFVDADKFRFHLADIDKNGVLTLKELRAFLHPHNHLEMLDYEVKKVLKDYDMNNDSKISEEELIFTQYGGGKMNPLQKTRINRIFENYDINKDRVLSSEEVKMWLKPDVSEYAKTEALHLMKVSDHNHDSQVTKDEILSSLEHWMSSKATNFGDHVRDEL